MYKICVNSFHGEMVSKPTKKSLARYISKCGLPGNSKKIAEMSDENFEKSFYEQIEDSDLGLSLQIIELPEIT